MQDLVSQMLSGDRLALSRLISQVEARSPNVVSIMAQVQTRCGRTHKIGVTGPPGAGKSTLVNALIAHFRKSLKQTVGVVAIDPSSPFSGGAVLGDRIRMQDHAGDEGVFIRSLGSRGSHGGLSRATREVTKLFDAFGMDRVIVETVGVGQTELDIMGVADTTIVILTPESGDSIQAMKAGILEIADIFVVNKSDRDGAAFMQAELRAMVEMGHGQSDWEIPVLATRANHGIGIPELAQALETHREYRKKQPDKGKTSRTFAVEEVCEIILEETGRGLKPLLQSDDRINLDNPYQTAKEYIDLIKSVLKK